MATTKNIILRAKLEGVLTDLMVKTNAANVYVDETTTLAAHLATLATTASVTELQNMIEALGALASKDKVSTDDLDDALLEILDLKAYKTDVEELRSYIEEQFGIKAEEFEAIEERVSTAEQTIGTLDEAHSNLEGSVGDLEGRVGNLEGRADEMDETVGTLVGTDTGKSVRTIANEELAAKLIPESASEALDTLEEIAAWIQSHPGDAAAMNAAITALQAQMTGIAAGEGTVKKYVDDAIAALNIGNYALAADLTALAGRVSALETTAAGLGTLATKSSVSEAELDAALLEKVNASAEGNHSHSNKDVLDGITANDVAAWNSKSTTFISATEPETLAEGDLWLQIVE